MLSADKNPFWLHAKKDLFLAYDDKGKVVGRVAAIIDYNYINFHNDNCGFFGFFECIDDEKIAKALIDEVQKWLAAHNIFKMMGPMNPSTNDECGFLCEGFEIPPSIMMTYTPKYYLNLAQSAGLKKIKELYAYTMPVTADNRLERLKRVAEMVKKRFPALEIRTLNIKDIRNELKFVMSVYNRAWEKNWGFVPWTNEEFEDIAKNFKPLLDPKLAILASISGSPVGMLVSIPDYNQVLKKLNGRLFPIGFLKFLYGKRKIDELRLMIMGVVKEHRNKGIEALMYLEGLKYALTKSYKHCELSWILDDNIPTQRTAEMMSGKIYKRYAIYAK
ncbi:MAG: hypothetical protein LBB93_00860 [Elusimicrobiota bacterium]|nr:hypothetical protein [Elusimicrobiota bacterium]